MRKNEYHIGAFMKILFCSKVQNFTNLSRKIACMLIEITIEKQEMNHNNLLVPRKSLKTY